MQIDSLETFLSSHIKAGSLKTKDSILLDIGAYQGSFTKFMLSEDTTIQQAILFEPNNTSYQLLKSNFNSDNRITLVNQALGNSNGTVAFYCNHDLATGSALEYIEEKNASESALIDCFQVEQTTLDSYIENSSLSKRISFIKIDAQGYDLTILNGALQTIQKHKPWLIVELIFIPLYHKQASYSAIMNWAAEQDYALGGLFNIHYTSNGRIAFADAIFIPNTENCTFETPYMTLPSSLHLKNEIGALTASCKERIDLILRSHDEITLLNNTNQERLALIHQLTNQIKQLEKSNKNRLDLINLLNKDIKNLHTSGAKKLFSSRYYIHQLKQKYQVAKSVNFNPIILAKKSVKKIIKLFHTIQ